MSDLRLNIERMSKSLEALKCCIANLETGGETDMSEVVEILQEIRDSLTKGESCENPISAEICNLGTVETLLSDISAGVDNIELTSENISLNAEEINLNTENVEMLLQEVIDELEAGATLTGTTNTLLTTIDNVLDAINVNTGSTNIELSDIKDLIDQIRITLANASLPCLDEQCEPLRVEICSDTTNSIQEVARVENVGAGVTLTMAAGLYSSISIYSLSGNTTVTTASPSNTVFLTEGMSVVFSASAGRKIGNAITVIGEPGTGQALVTSMRF